MKHKCSQCKKENIHSFSLRTDYGSFYKLNEFNSKGIPYFLEGYYCEDCQEAVSIKEEEGN